MKNTETATKSSSLKAPFVLSLVFFLSGFNALIYQVVWQRALTLYYGVGFTCITLIVSLFMAGLGIGGYLGGVLAERSKRLILLYAAIEFLIGLFGLESHPFLEALGRHTAGMPLSVAWSFICLFLAFPTVLMGMTLPLLTKVYNQFRQHFGLTISHLYFINTIGAAAGCLIASYIFISFLGLKSCLVIAAGINFALGIVIYAFRFSAAAPLAPMSADRSASPWPRKLSPRVVGLLVFLTGFMAIGYEIIWFRIVEVLVKASPYAFSSTLGVYLLGLALGSFAMNRFLSREHALDLTAFFFGIQVCIALYVLVSVLVIYYGNMPTLWGSKGPLTALCELSFRQELHPPAQWIVRTGDPQHPLFGSLDVFLWPIFFVFVPTLLIGASFPLVSILAYDPRSHQEGKTIGSIYFLVILGNVLGGLLTGFVLLPLLGTEQSLELLMALGFLFSLGLYRFGSGARAPVMAAAFALIAVLGGALFPKKTQLYLALHHPPAGYSTYITEGINGVIVTYVNGESVNNYINGLSHGGRPNNVFRLESLEALSYAAQSHRILVIGYGTGTMAEEVLKLEPDTHVKVIELNRTLIDNLRRIPLFEPLLADPHLELLIDDGRRQLQHSAEKYDMILMDPLRTTTVYSNNLYSQEFFELLQAHLNPGGVVMIWKDEDKVIPKTLASVFPYVRWYQRFCLASNEPFQEYKAREKHYLAGMSQADQKWIQLSRQYYGDQQAIQSATQGGPVNKDWDPICEYYLGMRARTR